MNSRIFILLAKNWGVLRIAALILLVFSASQLFANAQGNVKGALVALSSANNDKLQCTCSVGGDGAIHANNQQVNQEESWWIWTIGDPSQHQVALQNFRNNYFLWRHPGGSSNHRVRMIHDIGGDSTWTMISGKAYGLPGDYVGFKAYDGAYLKAWNGGGNGDAPGEGGEGYVDVGPPSGDPNWAGWWRMSQIGWTPTPGNDVWNALGDGVNTVLGGVWDALSWIASGLSDQNTPAPLAPPISCSTLPTVVSSGNDRWVHAFCEGVVPTDFPGTYYPADDPLAAFRVQCDIAAHHKIQPTHNVVSISCDASTRNTPDCPNMPDAPRAVVAPPHPHPQPPHPPHGQPY